MAARAAVLIVVFRRLHLCFRRAEGQQRPGACASPGGDRARPPHPVARCRKRIQRGDLPPEVRQVRFRRTPPTHPRHRDRRRRAGRACRGGAGVPRPQGRQISGACRRGKGGCHREQRCAPLAPDASVARNLDTLSRGLSCIAVTGHQAQGKVIPLWCKRRQTQSGAISLIPGKTPGNVRDPELATHTPPPRHARQ